ncbi:TonB-dependent receptor [Prolixibacteraceae bacterium JC049]|nr:TonB-dependent receptor [Prolixibacteraceae bacterium JC049]
MKKSNYNIPLFGMRRLLCLKITIFLLLFCGFQGLANVYSQNEILKISKSKARISEHLKEFDRMSDFRFFYASDLFDESAVLEIAEKEISVDNFLEKYIKPLGFKYSISDKTIIISKAEAQKAKAKVAPKADQKKNEIKVKGTVIDSKGAPVPGVTVVIVGSTKGIITDFDGTYDISVAPDAQLQFSFIGMSDQVVEVNGRKLINITMTEKTEELEDVTIVAFGKQKKESIMASIETVRPADLKVPASNLSTALAGRISGLISYQRSGEPGADDASFFVRGVTSFSYAAGPLILIDGVESTSQELASMQPDDIESFSIMKDAAATAVYGARGGNGVIMITTKTGREGKLQFSARHEQTWSMATDKIDLADPITYMKLHNEATLARDPFANRYYSLEKIEQTEKGANPYVYPANNWYDMLFNDVVRNSRTNFSLSGGTKKVNYYLAGTMNEDNGSLKVDNRNNFNNNIQVRNYVLRSNVGIKLTPTTNATIRFTGQFKDYNGPLSSGNDMYQMVLRSDPVAFAPYFLPEHSSSARDHILFGNDPNNNYLNPYAEMVKGYKEYTNTKMKTQVEVKQDLGFIVKGLKAKFLFATDRSSYFDAQRQYKPYYYYVTPGSYNQLDDTFSLTARNPEDGTEWLDYKSSSRKVNATNYFEMLVNYATTINDIHDITGMFVATRRNYEEPGDNLVTSLPHRNVGYSGRFTYGYGGKYFAEFNFGLNGSERFSEENRWGFFPSAGLGYLISKEPFWEGGLSKVFTTMKLKATYGLSGTDAIGDKEDRFFYLSNVDLIDNKRGYRWGEFGSVYSPGVTMKRYPNDKITWETSRKMNLGIETDIFEDFHFQVDYYTEHRSDILMERKNIPTTMGLVQTPTSNVGKAKGYGIDLSLDYNHSWNEDMWLSIRGNFTYAVSEFEYYEDVDRSETPWLNRTGYPTTQTWGYVAERLFIDQADVDNSPQQTFGEYGPGDIKYRDINGDGKISYDDQVPIGHPTRPEIVYGIGFSGGYKGFDLSCFFQGLANESFFIDTHVIQPFVRDKDGKHALLEVIANDHWSESNPDPKAFWPRLTDKSLPNNQVTSTWWMRNGAFVRLKSLEVGYTIPKSLTQRIGVKSLRIYATGRNLLTFSKFKMWDPEMAGNGFKYPIQKVYNLGVQISL